MDFSKKGFSYVCNQILIFQKGIYLFVKQTQNPTNQTKISFGNRTDTDFLEALILRFLVKNIRQTAVDFILDIASSSTIFLFEKKNRLDDKYNTACAAARFEKDKETMSNKFVKIIHLYYFERKRAPESSLGLT